jgi:hypothetical protein
VAAAATISVTVSEVIQRPVEEVRAHFADVPYHVQANIHPEFSMVVLTIGNRRCRFRQETRLLGMKHVDDVVNIMLDNGDMLSEVVAGSNRGLEIHYSYAPAPDGTLVTVRVEIPNGTFRHYLRRVIEFGVRRAALRVLAQDRRDLESGRYRRYRDRAARARPARPVA